jgi:carbon-monoxide dehydrogenase medium subunit
MKPAPFTLHAPSTLDEALEVLAECGDDGKVLAGGSEPDPAAQHAARRPGHLVDINGVPGLDRVEPSSDGVRVGALARHAHVHRDAGAAAAVPLLQQALSLVAHPVIRNRGTTVGSIAHADPSGEMTAVLALLGGSMELRSSAGSRTVAAEDFFLGPLETCMTPGELAVSAWFPALPAGSGTSFRELSRRHGDYAMCGVAAVVTLDGSGRIARAATSYISMTATPVVLELTDAVGGRPWDTADWGAAAELAVGQLDPEPDIHATAAYRRQLGRVLTRQALTDAAQAAAAATDSPLATSGGAR